MKAFYYVLRFLQKKENWLKNVDLYAMFKTMLF